MQMRFASSLKSIHFVGLYTKFCSLLFFITNFVVTRRELYITTYDSQKYCTILIDSAITHHRACGLGRIQSPVPHHNPYGRRLLVDPENGQKCL